MPESILYLYLVSQKVNNGYDTYDSFVVSAESEEAARHTHPGKFYKWREQGGWNFQFANGAESPEGDSTGDWCSPESVTVELIGVSSPGISGVVCASFNAG